MTDVTLEQKRDKGGVRLGLDFGVSATVIAASGPGRDTCTLEFPKISRVFPASPGTIPVHTVPSLVEYQDGTVIRLGGEVLRGGSADASSTARWLRRSLCDRNPVQVPAGDGRQVRYDEAVSDLLLPLLSQALREYPGAALVIALPPEAPAEYRGSPSADCPPSRCPVLLHGQRVCCCSRRLRIFSLDSEPVVLITFSETDLEVVVLVRDGLSGTGAGGGCGLRVLAQVTGQVRLPGDRQLDRAGSFPENSGCWRVTRGLPG